ncbi:hypothetical protein SpiBuddy_2127 [Sphaerochaeta globosa str. Buddy]|uniref:Uncharacterized protein n=1 Tax=Sphaerochaeta globosa (strain ATCC BAA-1886 / DSM 22777 / Buddy) TaxID=158189 RepID=F0RT01_SPHGB|nr:hypothetical protein SpiBuddy_2127 [Sphaerochaeta globosa str. Buddy]
MNEFCCKYAINQVFLHFFQYLYIYTATGYVILDKNVKKLMHISVIFVNI